MHFSVQGSGPPLLLIHGWAMHGGIFAPLVPYLEAHFTIHAVDLPGHGCSSGQIFELDDTLVELAAYLAPLAPATLVGWSLGGAIATQLALRFPAAVQSLVLIASSPCFVATADWANGMTQNAFRSFSEALARDWEGVVDRFLALETLGSPNERAELRWLREVVYAHGKPNPAALVSGLAMLESIDLRAQLAGLSVPNLWLGGRRDRIVPPQVILDAAKLSAGRAEILAAAHMPFLTHPELTANFIIALVDTVLPRQHLFDAGRAAKAALAAN